MPPPCFQWPRLAIAWVVVPFWAIPIRPLWTLKLSQPARPAAFTRRAICDSDIPNTLCRPSTPTGLMASRGRMAAEVTATTAPWAPTSVLTRTTVMRPLPSSQVNAAASEHLSPASDSTATRATSNRARSAACSGVSMPQSRREGSLKK